MDCNRFASTTNQEHAKTGSSPDLKGEDHSKLSEGKNSKNIRICIKPFDSEIRLQGMSNPQLLAVGVEGVSMGSRRPSHNRVDSVQQRELVVSDMR